MSGLSLVVLNYIAKLKFGLFFPSHPSSSLGTTRCPQPTKKKGNNKRNERGKKLTPVAIQVLFDHHQTFFDVKSCLVIAENRKAQATTRVFLGHH
jgi:hypothetical protein